MRDASALENESIELGRVQLPWKTAFQSSNSVQSKKSYSMRTSSGALYNYLQQLHELNIIYAGPPWLYTVADDGIFQTTSSITFSSARLGRLLFTASAHHMIAQRAGEQPIVDKFSAYSPSRLSLFWARTYRSGPLTAWYFYRLL